LPSRCLITLSPGVPVQPSNARLGLEARHERESQAAPGAFAGTRWGVQPRWQSAEMWRLLSSLGKAPDKRARKCDFDWAITFIKHSTPLQVFRYNQATLDWEEKPGTLLSLATSTVSVQTLSFSSYGVFEVPPLPPGPAAQSVPSSSPYPEAPPPIPTWAIVVGAGLGGFALLTGYLTLIKLLLKVNSPTRSSTCCLTTCLTSLS